MIVSSEAIREMLHPLPVWDAPGLASEVLKRNGGGFSRLWRERCLIVAWLSTEPAGLGAAFADMCQRIKSPTTANRYIEAIDQV